MSMDIDDSSDAIDADPQTPSSFSTVPAVSVQPPTNVPASPAPVYKMQRWIKSVNDLWHEYHVGFKIGGVQYPCIEELERLHKGKWTDETGNYIILIDDILISYIN